MNKILVFLALLLFWQSNNLDAMHLLFSKNKSNRNVDKLANLSIHIHKEALIAADTIQEWLNSDLISKLFLQQPNDLPIINKNVLNKLPIGQKIVLTQWKVYPHYGSLVLRELDCSPIKMQHQYLSPLISQIINIYDARISLRVALIVHNFDKKTLKWCQKIFNNEFKCLDRLDEFIPKLYELKNLYFKMNDVNFEKKLKKFEEDLQDCFFFMQHWNLFLNFNYIQVYARHNKSNVIKLFLAYGIDPNLFLFDFPYFDNNNSLLKIAISQENLEMVMLLLEHQADPLYSAKGPSPMIMSLKRVQHYNAIPQNVRDAHKALCLSISEEELHECECQVQCDVQFEEFTKHIFSKLCSLNSLKPFENLEFINTTLLDIYKNCFQVCSLETKSSYAFANIIAKIKNHEKEILQTNNILYNRMAHMLLGLLFVNITQNSQYMPLHDLSDFQELCTHLNILQSDLKKHFLIPVCSDELSHLKQGLCKEFLESIQKIIDQLLDENQFSSKSIIMTMNIIATLSELIEKDDTMIVEILQEFFMNEKNYTNL